MKSAIFTFFFAIPLFAISQIGINTETPEATLDINGDLIIRETDHAINYESQFYNLVADKTGKIYKSDSISNSYYEYLGFDPMAPTHTFNLPTPIEPGYITTINGIAIGSCFGATVKFTLTYKGLDLLSAEILRFKAGSYAEASTIIYAGDESTLYSKPLEQLPGTICRGYGHTLSSTITDGIKRLSVTFTDALNYYPDSGTFAVTNASRIKYIPNK